MEKEAKVMVGTQDIVKDAARWNRSRRTASRWCRDGMTRTSRIAM